jgi:hypothetical protein
MNNLKYIFQKIQVALSSRNKEGEKFSTYDFAKYLKLNKQPVLAAQLSLNRNKIINC